MIFYGHPSGQVFYMKIAVDAFQFVPANCRLGKAEIDCSLQSNSR